uniref:Uncharacterized protein n=1 Tax=viral metagenome TaxID=1070528 RepID=A0A6C0AG45_9ZZZZ
METDKLINNYELELEMEMEKNSERFSFIHVLHKKDRNKFIQEYIKILKKDDREFKYFDRGYIKISTWLKIMENIDLSHCYNIYRNSYYGENTGILDISEIKTNFKVLLVELNCNSFNTIDLLIDDKKISRIYLFRTSNFINPNKWFWENIIK